MLLSNEELKSIYFGAYFFEETDGGWLQAFQYSKAQMDYFKKAFDFWYDRCMASTAKTLEFATDAERIAFEYKIIWTGSLDSFEVAVDGLITEIRYVTDHGDPLCEGSGSGRKAGLHAARRKKERDGLPARRRYGADPPL